MGKLDFRLGRQLASYQTEDSYPTRVWPLPVRVIQALDIAVQGTTPRNIAIRYLAWVAFFLLLITGQYCKGGTDTTQPPFRLKDVQFSIGQQPYNAATASNAVLAQVNFVSLIFTTHKNGVNGESIGHGRTGHPQLCPVASMCRQVTYIQRHGATSKTPLSSIKKASKWQQIRGDNIMAAIISFVRAAGPEIGFTKADISACSLRVGRAMALLMARVDPDTIRLVGMWQSNTMLRYLHTTAKNFTEGLSEKMFQHGAYVLIPPARAGN